MLENQPYYSQDEFNNVLRMFITSRDDIESIDLTLDSNFYSTGVKKLGLPEEISPVLLQSAGQPVWLPTNAKRIEILSGPLKRILYPGQKGR